MKSWHIQMHRTLDNRLVTWPYVGFGDSPEQAVIDVCKQRPIFIPFVGIKFRWRDSACIPGLNEYFVKAHPAIRAVTRNGFVVTAYEIK